ncbi:MAG TPA: hypothetical protein VFQ92_03165, partial [Blastocatellia bacterium]|nr:hypothetical protein [Blastocatellia bacterium]
RPRVRDGVTVLPVEGFTRPDRASTRPSAPGRDEGQWLDRGARAGLPEITPTTEAAAPAWRGSDSRPGPARSFAPPVEVMNRPVVTRNRPADPQVATSAPRERRLVAPRKDRARIDVPAPKNNGHNHSAGQESRDRSTGARDDEKDSRGDRRSSGGIRPGPVTPGPAQDASERKERDRRPKDDADNSEKLKNRSRERFIPIPAPKSGGTETEKPRDNSDPARDKRTRPRDNNDSGAERERKQQRGEAASPRQDRPQPRPEVKVERRQESGGQREQRRKGHGL